MAEFVFTSPGVKFRERNLTFVTRNVGITTLGLVGETLKGPAFEPVFVQDKTEFSQRFGAQSIKRFSNGLLQYQLPYVANAYLDESNQLYVTRVLGLSGYDAGTAWMVTLSAGVDPATTGTSTVTGPTTVPFTGGTYLGVTLSNTGQTGSTFTGYTKVSATEFEGYSHEFSVLTYTGSTLSGTVSDTVTLLTGTSYSEYENMVLAVIRSRGYVVDHVNAPATTTFNTSSLTMSGNSTLIGVGDLFGQFILRAISTASTETYTVTLNPSSSSFLPNVIGLDAKDKSTKIWTQAVYPDLIKWLDSTGIGYGINTTLLSGLTSFYTNYRTQFKTPETPWVVSQIKGNTVDKLFKFVSISDGDSANQEIKISIANINPITLEFDVVIRNFNDTDDNPTILEQFTRCNLIKGTNGYLAQRIGTTDSEYDLQSKYVMVELDTEIVPDVFPAGFDGYLFNNYDSAITGDGDGIAPKILYKTQYNDDERPRKVYLGVSEKAYSTTNLAGTGINQNFFNFNGYGATSGFTTTQGFHMDSGATSVIGYDFQVGAGRFQTIDDVIDQLNPYFELVTRKFTLVPAGGFDGWDVNRTSRSYGDLYDLNKIFDGVVPNGDPMNDFQAWETAINTFANPEEVTINLFATPGINWSDQDILVKNTIEMLETERTDSLYIIDSPDIGSTTPVIGSKTKSDVIAAQDVVELLDTAEIDSSYACTYFPWIQMRDDQNNVNVYIPPTGEVVKAMAFTDNNKFPWFAPAGLTRGVTDARKSKLKLSLDARDVLYA
ncbi:MAG: hypothetical protein WC341_14715, partial [Bacteroidales bacterium]